MLMNIIFSYYFSLPDINIKLTKIAKDADIKPVIIMYVFLF